MHVPSGIYLRGDVNTWSPVEEWEFSDLGNGEYILYDKTLSGAFKVADASWSSACNYGSNGTNIFPDTPYALKSGTDDNISCGSNVYAASEIRLTIANGSASLLIKSNDDPTGLTKVYMVGDFNNWNYMNTDGALTLDTADGLYKGFVSMPDIGQRQPQPLAYLPTPRQGRRVGSIRRRHDRVVSFRHSCKRQHLQRRRSSRFL